MASKYNPSPGLGEEAFPSPFPQGAHPDPRHSLYNAEEAACDHSRDVENMREPKKLKSTLPRRLRGKQAEKLSRGFKIKGKIGTAGFLNCKVGKKTPLPSSWTGVLTFNHKRNGKRASVWRTGQLDERDRKSCRRQRKTCPPRSRLGHEDTQGRRMRRGD